ncbi:hypothetical protein HOY82DRAFT_366865 [Tuber indicum]|nr:hypothetical protein HOY82DRAFT_366865 [Tuber indicum]
MSTAMLSQPATVAVPSAIATPPGPASPAKKRRRRAPATGAAEDCFTCRANGIKCDRRRPYCGPCLDVGMGCKGYRTQLTWGVGVASRGKLRGLHLPIQTPVADPKDAKKIVKKKGDEKTSGVSENGLRSKRSKTSLDGNGRDYDNSQRNGNSGVGKLSIITSYDFVNMEPPSNSSSAVSRTSSTRSANSSAISTGTSPALSGISRNSMPSQRITQGQRSPQSSSSYTPSYPASSQPQYRIQSQQQQYRQSPVHHYHKSPYSHVSLPPQQPTSSMLLSPMSEYGPKYESKYEPSFPSSQHYPMSSAPSTAPLYEMVTGVSSASYHPSASMTVTTTGVSYAPMVASMHATSRMMGDDHLHNPNHHHQNGGPGWNGVGVGIGNLHHQHVPAGTGNLSDLLYDDGMLGTF